GVGLAAVWVPSPGARARARRPGRGHRHGAAAAHRGLKRVAGPRYPPRLMRIAAAAAALLGIAAFSAAGAGSSPGATTTRSVLDVGDSLSVGAAPYLHARLRGFRIEEDYDVGLHPSHAARIVAATRPLPSVLVVSAGTNDDPRIVSTFAHAVTTILAAAGSRRCVVWPTIVRPPAVGASYAGINRALTQAAA